MTAPNIGDYVRFGEGPYNVYQVNHLYDGEIIGTKTVHGIYTELPANEVEVLDREAGVQEKQSQIELWRKERNEASEALQHHWLLRLRSRLFSLLDLPHQRW
jgi:gamma-glutamylcyclotransferase (GGCT)/AIG2-like uncharacterized protein YtfP